MKDSLSLLSTYLQPLLSIVAVVWGLVRFRHQVAVRFLPTYGRGLLLIGAFLATSLPHHWMTFTAAFPGGGRALLFAIVVAVVLFGVTLPALVGLWNDPSRTFPTVLFGGAPSGRGIAWGLGWAVVSTALSYVLYFTVEGVPKIDPGAVSTSAEVFLAPWWAEQVVSWVWAPFNEEFASRGLLLGAVVLLAKGRPPVMWAGIALVSFLWACGHTHQWDAWPVRVVWLMAEGCVYSWLVLRFNIEAAVVGHMFSNVLATVVPFVVLPWLI